jgi:hypothetical protein
MGCKSPFSARIVCGDCGGFYGKKVWGSRKDDKRYRRYIWQCNDKYAHLDKPAKGCTTPHITEDDIKVRFLAVWNGMASNRDELISDCKAAKTVLCDCKDINTELAELQREIEVVTELLRKATYENARVALNQAEFTERSDGYFERQRMANERIAKLETEKCRRQLGARILQTFIRNLTDSPQALTEFDEKLWATTIDRVTVFADGRMAFKFMSGRSVEG